MRRSPRQRGAPRLLLRYVQSIRHHRTFHPCSAAPAAAAQTSTTPCVAALLATVPECVSQPPSPGSKNQRPAASRHHTPHVHACASPVLRSLADAPLPRALLHRVCLPRPHGVLRNCNSDPVDAFLQTCAFRARVFRFAARISDGRYPGAGAALRRATARQAFGRRRACDPTEVAWQVEEPRGWPAMREAARALPPSTTGSST